MPYYIKTGFWDKLARAPKGYLNLSLGRVEGEFDPIITSDGSLDRLTTTVDTIPLGTYIPDINFIPPRINVSLNNVLYLDTISGIPPTQITFDNIESINTISTQVLSSSSIKNFYFPKLLYVQNLTVQAAAPLLQSVDFPELVSIGSLNFASFPLIPISFPKLRFTTNLISAAVPSVANPVSLPALELVGDVSFASNVGNYLVTAPKLKRVINTFSITSQSFFSLKFPLLEEVGINFAVTIPLLPSSATSFDLSNLKTIGGTFNLTLAQTFGSTSYNLPFPSLEVIKGGTFNFTGPRILSIDLPKIIRIGENVASLGINVISANTTNLTTYTLGNTLKQVGNTAFGGNVLFSNCALNQASVDNILIRLAALDGTNGTTSFNNRSVTILGTSATPSAAGLVAKATLQARGCTVTNN